MFSRITAKTNASVAKSAAKVANKAANTATRAANAAAKPSMTWLERRAANKAAATAVRQAAAAKKIAEAAAAKAATAAAAAAKNEAAKKAAANKAAATAAAKAAAVQAAANKVAAAKAAKEADAAQKAAAAAAQKAAKNAAQPIIKRIGKQVAGLGTSAYAMYTQSGNAQALTIAATCFILLLIAKMYFREPVHIRDLRRNIATLNKRITAQRKLELRIVNRIVDPAARLAAVRNIYTHHNQSVNATRLREMQVELRRLTTEIANVAPSATSTIRNIVQEVLPFAREMLNFFREAKLIEHEASMAQSESRRRELEIRALNAETRAQAASQLTEQRIAELAAPAVGYVRAGTTALRAGAAMTTNVVTAGKAVKNAGAPLLRMGLAVGEFYQRKRRPRGVSTGTQSVAV